MFPMTAMTRLNIPAAINTLEGLTIWATATYAAAYGGKSYGEQDSTDLQRFGRFSIAPVESKENGSSLFYIARVAVPVDPNLIAQADIAWLNVVEHGQQAVLPAGYLA
jgi:hypothetical protein